LLDLPAPSYWHVPLVLGDDGQRLAKRHGAVTLSALRGEGWTVTDVVGVLARSLGLAAASERVTAAELVDRFDPELVPKTAVMWSDLRGETTMW
jgi:glutamyl-tRNA synthetase